MNLSWPLNSIFKNWLSNFQRARGWGKLEIRIQKGLWRKQWKFKLPSVCTAALLIMLLPRNICLGPQHTPRVQAEGSEMHLVIGDYPCASSLLPLWLVPNGTAGDPETKWTPFQEAEIRRLRNYGAIQTLSMLLRTWPDLALIKVNQPIRGRLERRSKWGWMLMQQGTKDLAGNRRESLFLQMREMLHCALPYVRCNLWPYGWRTFLTPKAWCWTWSKLDGARGRKEFAVFQRQLKCC